MSHLTESFSPAVDINDRKWIVFDPELFVCKSGKIAVRVPPLRKSDEEPTFASKSKEKLYNKPESLIGQLIHHLVQKRLCDGKMPDSESIFVDFQKFLSQQTKGSLLDGLSYVEVLMTSAGRIADQMAYDIACQTPANTQWIREIPFGPSTSQMRYINKLLGFAGTEAMAELDQNAAIQELAKQARTSADFRLPIDEGDEVFLAVAKEFDGLGKRVNGLSLEDMYRILHRGSDRQILESSTLTKAAYICNSVLDCVSQAFGYENSHHLIYDIVTNPDFSITLPTHDDVIDRLMMLHGIPEQASLLNMQALVAHASYEEICYTPVLQLLRSLVAVSSYIQLSENPDTKADIVTFSARPDIIGFSADQCDSQSWTTIDSFTQLLKGNLFGRQPLHDMRRFNQDGVYTMQSICESLLDGRISLSFVEIKTKNSSYEYDKHRQVFNKVVFTDAIVDDHADDVAHTLFAMAQFMIRMAQTVPDVDQFPKLAQLRHLLGSMGTQKTEESKRAVMMMVLDMLPLDSRHKYILARSFWGVVDGGDRKNRLYGLARDIRDLVISPNEIECHVKVQQIDRRHILKSIRRVKKKHESR